MDEQVAVPVIFFTSVIYLSASVLGFVRNLDLWVVGKPVNWRSGRPCYWEPEHDPLYARRMVLWLVWPLWLAYTVTTKTGYWVFVILHDAITGRRWFDRNKED